MPGRNISSFSINEVCPLYKKTDSSKVKDYDVSKAFDVERNINTDRAKHHMTTLSWMRNENFDTGLHFVNSEKDEDFYT